MILAATMATALAHVGLEEPAPRYPTDGYSDNKSCPCGVGGNDQYCSNAAELSDPNRSGNVTQYEAGQTITVRAHEVIGHAGRWRVAFDPDGADLADFNANILLDVADPPGGEGNVGQGDLWEFTVTLPAVACTTCTLQLVQMMDGNTVDPVPDPTGRSSYFQCADLVLTAPPEPTDSDTPPTDSGTTTPGPTDTGTPPTPTDGTTPSTSSTTSAGDDSGGGKEGCGCATGVAPGPLALFALAALRRRRR